MKIIDTLLHLYGFNPQFYKTQRQERNAKILTVFFLLSHVAALFFFIVNLIIKDPYARYSNSLLFIITIPVIAYYKKSQDTTTISLIYAVLLFLDTASIHLFTPIELYANIAWMACIIFFISTIHSLKTSILMTIFGTFLYLFATISKALYPHILISEYTPTGALTLNILIISFASIIAIVLTILIKEEERKIQEFLEQQKEHFETLANTNSALISMVGHDIATPLLATQLILKKLPNDIENIKQLKENIHSIQAITQNIRTFQAYKKGKLQLNTQIVDLVSIIQKSINAMLQRQQQKNITINFLYDHQNTYQIKGDEVILQLSIFQNLLTNAIKFSPSHSTIHIFMEKIKDHLEIRIKDEGIGIPDKLLKKIFNFDSATTRVGTAGEKGTGFGMPLVKMFVTEFGGTIHIESSTLVNNSGTTFILQFPLLNAPQ